MIVNNNNILLQNRDESIGMLHSLDSMLCDYGLLITTGFYPDEILSFLDNGTLFNKKHPEGRLDKTIGFILDKDMILWEFIAIKPNGYRASPVRLNKHVKYTVFNNKDIDTAAYLGLALDHTVEHIVNTLDRILVRFNKNDFSIYSLDLLREFLKDKKFKPIVTHGTKITGDGNETAKPRQ